MSEWPLKHDGPCKCRFVRREEFGEVDQVEWCALHENQRDLFIKLKQALQVLIDHGYEQPTRICIPKDKWDEAMAQLIEINDQ